MTAVRARFTPTRAQIAAAQTLCAAMALEQTIHPIVVEYEAAILAKHRFPIARNWVERGCEDELILDRERAYLLEEADAKIYYAECFAARDAAGLKVRAPDHCPLCEAESLRIAAENALLHEIATTPGLEHLGKGFLPPKLRDEAITLTLRLLAPFIGGRADILARFLSQS